MTAKVMTMAHTDTLAAQLRQMIAVLQTERQALAGMDLDALLACTADKDGLCNSLQDGAGSPLNDECRGLLVSARELNDVNRRVRNLLAVNVAARLDALTGSGGTYQARQMNGAPPPRTATGAT